MARPMTNDPPFARLNHFASDLGIPRKSADLRIGIKPRLRPWNFSFVLYKYAKRPARIEVVLRERDFDALALERVPQRQQHLAAHIGEAVDRIADPETQDEVERGIAECFEVANGMRRRQDARHGFDRFQRQRDHLVRVGGIGDAELDIEPHLVVGIGPVDHALGDEVLVWDQELAAVARDHRGVARAHRADPAERVADRDYVARLDRLVGEQDDAAHQIGHDLLQAEAEADADRAGEECERGKIDPDGRQGNHNSESDQQQADQLADQHLDGRSEIGCGAYAPLKEVAGSVCRPQREQQQDGGLDDQERRHPQAADHHAHRVERCLHRMQQAEDAERGDRPGRYRHQPVGELVADEAGDQSDHHPGGGEAGGDAEQVRAARPGQRLHRRMHQRHHHHEDEGGEIGQHVTGELAQQRRPAHGHRREMNAVADQRRGQISGDGGEQNQADLDEQPERGDFLAKVVQRVADGSGQLLDIVHSAFPLSPPWN